MYGWRRSTISVQIKAVSVTSLATQRCRRKTVSQLSKWENLDEPARMIQYCASKVLNGKIYRVRNKTATGKRYYIPLATPLFPLGTSCWLETGGMQAGCCETVKRRIINNAGTIRPV